jgi:hypothetical protein
VLTVEKPYTTDERDLAKVGPESAPPSIEGATFVDRSRHDREPVLKVMPPHQAAFLFPQ